MTTGNNFGPKISRKAAIKLIAQQMDPTVNLVVRKKRARSTIAYALNQKHLVRVENPHDHFDTRAFFKWADQKWPSLYQNEPNAPHPVMTAESHGCLPIQALAGVSFGISNAEDIESLLHHWIDQMKLNHEQGLKIADLKSELSATQAELQEHNDCIAERRQVSSYYGKLGGRGRYFK